MRALIVITLLCATSVASGQSQAALAGIVNQSSWVSTGTKKPPVWVVVETTCKYCGHAWEKMKRSDIRLNWVPSGQSGRLSELQAAEMLAPAFSAPKDWGLVRQYDPTARITREGMLSAKSNRALVAAANLSATPAFIYRKGNGWHVTYGVPSKKDMQRWYQ